MTDITRLTAIIDKIDTSICAIKITDEKERLVIKEIEHQLGVTNEMVERALSICPTRSKDAIDRPS